MSGDTDLEFEEFCDLLVRLGWAVYGPRGAAAQSVLPQRLTLSEALVELLDHHSVLRLALQEDRLIFLNLVQDVEVQTVLQQHEQVLHKVWKSYQDRRRAADEEELKGLNAVQFTRLLEDTGALASHLSREMTCSIFEVLPPARLQLKYRALSFYSYSVRRWFRTQAKPMMNRMMETMVAMTRKIVWRLQTMPEWILMNFKWACVPLPCASTPIRTSILLTRLRS